MRHKPHSDQMHAFQTALPLPSLETASHLQPDSNGLIQIQGPPCLTRTHSSAVWPGTKSKKEQPQTALQDTNKQDTTHCSTSFCMPTFQSRCTQHTCTHAKTPSPCWACQATESPPLPTLHLLAHFAQFTPLPSLTQCPVIGCQPT
jgi:hypothetical protein